MLLHTRANRVFCVTVNIIKELHLQRRRTEQMMQRSFLFLLVYGIFPVNAWCHTRARATAADHVTPQDGGGETEARLVRSRTTARVIRNNTPSSIFRQL